MKITFLSNYFSHHQKPLSDKWYTLTQGKYTFVESEEITDERKKLGWGIREKLPYIVSLNNEAIDKEILMSDAVIIGSAPFSKIIPNLHSKKLVFKYSERIFKNGCNYLKLPFRLYTYYKNYGRYKSLYLLCASAYTYADFAMYGTFRGKAYKWGYFPQTLKYDTNELFANKNPRKLLWCGRFLDWKHPDDALYVAKRLKEDGYDFELDFIGTGELRPQLETFITENDLGDNVKILGSMSPDEVRKYMETAGIYLFTSDFREGWGAVLNESMNSGCTVVANHAIGSVPFLLKNNENGLIYKNGDNESLYRKVKFLLDNPQEQQNLGKNAYKTIAELWNADVAATRFIDLCNDIKSKGYCDRFTEGPCSKAPKIKNNWFKED
ncbi:MAG: glycosyltransferase family 4 protein [Ruminococcaceae bacterium]|nr:glycosyltransferase family 4 protein [Oscillospiraceae bacterium]